MPQQQTRRRDAVGGIASLAQAGARPWIYHDPYRRYNWDTYRGGGETIRKIKRKAEPDKDDDLDTELRQAYLHGIKAHGAQSAQALKRIMYSRRPPGRLG